MDHALRTISYIADIGDLVVLMARRRFVPHDVDDPPKVNRTPKMICHVFESEEVKYYLNFFLYLLGHYCSVTSTIYQNLLF